MKRTAGFLAILLAASALALPVRAYDDFFTHPDLTILATQKSALYLDGSIMRNLGLYPAANQQFIYGARFPEYRVGTAYYSLSEFIGEGAYDEDSGTTPRHHFYDPHFERALTFGSNHKSWEWALEEPTTDLFQSWSLRDAREYLRNALTFNEGSPQEAYQRRRQDMAKMFLSLGHVMHHIQDMAQPQHVRNDMHLDRTWAIFIDIGLGTSLYNPSRYEAYTKQRRDAVRQIGAGASPLDLSSGNFRVAKDFWKNPGGTGMAERTNRDFVSAGTNFVEGGSHVTRGGYPQPLAGIGTEYTVEALYAESGVPVPAAINSMCGTPATGCTMIMVATNTTPKASTLSIFDQDLRRNGITVQWDGIVPTLTRVLYSLNRFNFDSAHSVLINRAVSYSAGFLNHFFRGKLDVLRPANGAWSAVDHSSGNGFTTIRARITNASGEEALSGGTLRAIARFHRNNCYQSDLSGEFTINEGTGELVPPCPNYRSSEAHLRMTAPEQVTFEPGEMKEMTFNFSEAIPFDATDLILQVYYEGTVGIEPNSFAVGAADLSEPTYFSVMNATDVFELSGNGFYYWPDIINGIANPPFDVVDIDANDVYNTPPDVYVYGGDISYEISVDGRKVADVTLPEGRFARIAALVSPFGATLTLRAIGNGFNTINSYQFGAKQAQYDPAQNAYIVSVVGRLRSQAWHFNSVTYWHYFPTTGTQLRRMPVSNAADPTIPVQVQMTPP